MICDKEKEFGNLKLTSHQSDQNGKYYFTVHDCTLIHSSSACSSYSRHQCSLEAAASTSWTVTFSIDTVVHTVDISTFLTSNISDGLTLRWTVTNLFGAIGWITKAVLLAPTPHTGHNTPRLCWQTDLITETMWKKIKWKWRSDELNGCSEESNSGTALKLSSLAERTGDGWKLVEWVENI